MQPASLMQEGARLHGPPILPSGSNSTGKD